MGFLSLVVVLLLKFTAATHESKGAVGDRRGKFPSLLRSDAPLPTQVAEATTHAGSSGFLLPGIRLAQQDTLAVDLKKPGKGGRSRGGHAKSGGHAKGKGGGHAKSKKSHLRKDLNGVTPAPARQGLAVIFGGHARTWYLVGVGVAFLSAGCCFAMLLWPVFAACGVYAQTVRKTKSAAGHEYLYDDWSWRQYLQYRFGRWFSWTPSATVQILFYTFVMILMFFTILYWAMLKTSMGRAGYKVFLWLVSPDGGSGETVAMGSILGALVSLAGLFIFALLVTIVQDLFSQYLNGLKEGQSRVMASGHLVIVGYSGQTPMLLQELCSAYEDTGGTIIAVLAEGFKPDVDAMIRDAGVDQKGSEITVRSGQADDVQALRSVSAENANTIIVMPDSQLRDGLRDSSLMRSVMSMRGAGIPHSGRIVAACSLARHKHMCEEIGDQITDIVVLDDITAKTMAQASHRRGLGCLVRMTYGFAGSEFYFRDIPDHLVGVTFRDASAYYPGGILVGVVTEDKKLVLCPGVTRTLERGEQLTLLADGPIQAKAAETPYTVLPPIESCTSAVKVPRTKAPEFIFIFGWTRKVANLLKELSLMVSPGTEVIIVGERGVSEREQCINLFKKSFDIGDFPNIVQITHVEGKPGECSVIEHLPVPLSKATRIFVFSDDSIANVGLADAVTLSTLLYIWDLVLLPAKTEGGKVALPSIIPEIHDPKTAEYCGRLGMLDYVDTGLLRAQYLSMIAYDPAIGRVLEEIISQEGIGSFDIHALAKYLPAGKATPQEISFNELQSMVSSHGDVLIGWSDGQDAGVEEVEVEQRHIHKVPGQSRRLSRSCSRFESAVLASTHEEEHVTSWAINPKEKNTPRFWSERHRLAVITSEVGT